MPGHKCYLREVGVLISALSAKRVIDTEGKLEQASLRPVVQGWRKAVDRIVQGNMLKSLKNSEVS